MLHTARVRAGAARSCVSCVRSWCQSSSRLLTGARTGWRRSKRATKEVGRGEQSKEIVFKVQQALELLTDMGGGIKRKCRCSTNARLVRVVPRVGAGKRRVTRGAESYKLCISKKAQRPLPTKAVPHERAV